MIETRSASVASATDESEPDAHARSIRHAILRSALTGLALAVTFALCEIAVAGFESRTVREATILGLSIGLVAILTAVVEALAGRRRAGARRDAAALVATFAVTFGGLVLATLQWAYAASLTSGGELKSAWKAVEESGGYMLKHPRDYICVFAASAVPFALMAALRLRKWRVLAQSLALSIVCALVSFPILAIARRGQFIKLEQISLWLVCAAGVLPIVTWLSESIERRLARLLSRHETTAASAPARKRLGFLPALALLIATAGVSAATIAEGRGFLEDPNWARWRPRPGAAAIAAKYDAMAAGKLTPAEVAALVSSTLDVKLVTRPRLAQGDPLCLELAGELTAAPDVFLTVMVTLDLGGETTQLNAGFQCNDDKGAPVTQMIATRSLVSGGEKLAPGVHDFPCTIQLLLDRVSPNGQATPTGSRLWTATRTETARVEVVAGESGAVKLVSPELDISDLDFSAAARGIRIQSTSNVELPVALVGQLMVMDETGALIAKDAIFIEPGTYVWVNVSFTRALPKGKHELTVTITPDPKLALERSATITEIYGGTIVRKVAVDIR